MKKLLLLFILIVGCSKDDSPDIDSGCECQAILFKATVNRDQGIYDDYLGNDCLSYWQGDQFNVDIDTSVSPPVVYGPTKEQVDIDKKKAGRCQ